MSISHYLIPVNLEKGKNSVKYGNYREWVHFSSTNFSVFSLMMIMYPEKVLPYFRRDKYCYDFIFSFKKFEVSEDYFASSEIRIKLIEIINTLSVNSGFALENYNCFLFEIAKYLIFHYLIRRHYI